jgi:hypothetical protein
MRGDPSDCASRAESCWSDVPLIRGLRCGRCRRVEACRDSEKRGIVTFTSPSSAASSAWSSRMCVVRTVGPSPTPDR